MMDLIIVLDICIQFCVYQNYKLEVNKQTNYFLSFFHFSPKNKIFPFSHSTQSSIEKKIRLTLKKTHLI